MLYRRVGIKRHSARRLVQSVTLWYWILCWRQFDDPVVSSVMLCWRALGRIWRRQHTLRASCAHSACREAHPLTELISRNHEINFVTADGHFCSWHSLRMERVLNWFWIQKHAFLFVITKTSRPNTNVPLTHY